MGFIFRRRRNRHEFRTDDAEREVWFWLSQDHSEFAVRHKLLKYYAEEKIECNEQEVSAVATYFAYCAKQAEEYFRASIEVSILTRPLLLFYGMVCLGKLLILLHKPKYIQEMREERGARLHGLGFRESHGSSHPLMEDDEVIIQEEGTFSAIYQTFRAHLPDQRSYKLGELYGWMPDLYKYSEARPNIKPRLATISCELVSVDQSMAIQIKIPPVIGMSSEELYAIYPFLKEHFGLTDVNGQRVFTGKTNKVKKDFLPQSLDERRELEENLARELEGFLFPYSRYNYNSVEYLVPGENEFSLNPLLASYMVAYGLSRLCRYNPAKWGQVVEGKETDELWIAQRFIELTTKTFPWEVLQLMFGKPIIV